MEEHRRNEYTVVAFDRALRIKQDGNEFELDCERQTGTIYGKAIWIWIRIMRGLQS